MAVADALGFPVRFTILPGQAHGLAGVPDLPEGLSSGTLAGGRAYDAAWLLGEVGARGAEAVIPPGRNRTEPGDHDREKCGRRRRIGNLFARIEEFRAVAARYDRTDESFAAAVHPVAGAVAAT